MESIDRLTEEFREKYAAFCESCADAEKHLSMIVADGNVGESETDYLNRTFGFTYTVEELLDLYAFSARDLSDNYADNIRDVLSLLRDADRRAEEAGGPSPALAPAFCDLTLLISGIIAESCEGVGEAEEEQLRRLRESILA